MNLKERAKEVVVDNNGIAKSADFVAAGIRAVDVVNLCNAGFLNRVRHGYYQLAEQGVSSEEQLLATLIPKGIVCVESALFHYGYSDFAPRKWSIAVPRSMSRTKLKVDSLAIQPYYMQPELYELGKITDNFNGVTLWLAFAFPICVLSHHIPSSVIFVFVSRHYTSLLSAP